MSEMERNMKNFMYSSLEPSGEQMDALGQMASKYSNKSEGEMLEELRSLNKEMSKDKKKHDINMKKLDELNGFLDEEQKLKLKKIMEFLNPKDKNE